MFVNGQFSFFIIFVVFTLVHCAKDFSKCGQNQDRDFHFIIGPSSDSETNPVGTWPWMASLGFFEDDKWNHKCGATLVSDHHFLTAAHCTSSIHPNWQIRIGVVKFDEKEKNSIVLDIENSTEHYKYIEEAYFDIAIITTKQIEFTKQIRPICLPKSYVTNVDKYMNNQMIITGWGASSVRGAESNILKRAEVVVYDHMYCNSTHEAIKNNAAVQSKIETAIPRLFQSQLLCAGNNVGREGSCKGDSGGPMFFFNTSTQSYVQVGVIEGSVGECGDRLIPSLFVRLDDPEILHFVQCEVSGLCEEEPETTMASLPSLHSPPTSINELKDGNKILIKNALTSEYLYPGSDDFLFNPERRNVFARKHLPYTNVGIWILEEDQRFPGSFRIKSGLKGEYLYAAADDLKFDPDRRRIFTWINDPDTTEKIYYWQFIPINNGGQYLLKNLGYGDGIYRANFSDGDNRRFIFGWNNLETIGNEGHWILEPLPQGHTKLLVSIGHDKHDNITNNVEIIDLTSTETTCKDFKDFPLINSEAHGGLGFQDSPTICGGWNQVKTCRSYINNGWRVKPYMTIERTAGAMTKSPFPGDGSQFIITGGNNLNGLLDSAEVWTKTEWKLIPPMPHALYRHCMVLVNSTTVLVVGGHPNASSYETSAKTYFFNSETMDWTEGPEMHHKKSVTTCGMINRHGKNLERSVIVAGGFDNWEYYAFTEILDLDSSEWRMGPLLPFGIVDAVMVEDSAGGVIVVGGSDGKEPLDTLIRLPHAGEDAEWEILPQKLKVARHYHTAFMIPEKLTECKKL